MSEPKKQSFLHGTMLLTVAAILVKVIGAIYKIPLNDIIGEQGFGYYNTAYEAVLGGLLGSYAIEKNGEILPVSRRKWTLLKSAFIKFDIVMKGKE